MSASGNATCPVTCQLKARCSGSKMGAAHVRHYALLYSLAAGPEEGAIIQLVPLLLMRQHDCSRGLSTISEALQARRLGRLLWPSAWECQGARPAKIADAADVPGCSARIHPQLSRRAHAYSCYLTHNMNKTGWLDAGLKAKLGHEGEHGTIFEYLCAWPRLETGTWYAPSAGKWLNQAFQLIVQCALSGHRGIQPR